MIQFKIHTPLKMDRMLLGGNFNLKLGVRNESNDYLAVNRLGISYCCTDPGKIN